jgi:hypothetical protein
MGGLMYTLLYTENANIKLRTFESIEKLQLFAGQFTIANMDNTDDNAIEGVIQGSPVLIHPSVRVDDAEGFQP